MGFQISYFLVTLIVSVALGQPGPGDLDPPGSCETQSVTDCVVAFGLTSAHTFQNCGWDSTREICVNCSDTVAPAEGCYKDPTLSELRGSFDCSLFDGLPNFVSTTDCELAFTAGGDRCAALKDQGYGENICRVCSYFDAQDCPVVRTCIVDENNNCVSKASFCTIRKNCSGECYNANGLCGFCGNFAQPDECQATGCNWDNSQNVCVGVCKSRGSTQRDCEQHDGQCIFNKTTNICQPNLTQPLVFSASVAATSASAMTVIVASSVGGALAVILVIVGAFVILLRQQKRVASENGSSKQMATSSRDSITIHLSTGSNSMHKLIAPDSKSCRQLKLIGRGANGSVYSCSLPDGSIVAMKEILLPPTTDYSTLMTSVQREVDIVSSFDHPNIIKFYGSNFDCSEHRLVIYMELVSHGSLGGLVRSMQERLPEDIARIYAAQIVSALAYIHARNVVHRDLKCDNILLTESGQIKLADFGASKTVEASKTSGAQTLIGTPFFMAPEMLNCGDSPDDGYGRRADVWSLGITLLEMMNRGHVPWPEFSNVNTAILHIASENTLPIIPDSCSAELKDFLAHCCCRDPLQRYTSAQLLDHPWLAPAFAQQSFNLPPVTS